MDSSARLDRASPEEATALLARCCGSARWIERMTARRPFGSDATLLSAARAEWFALSPVEWLDAFTHHPKIGGRDALRAKFAATRPFSAQEQSGVTDATDDVLDALAEGNREYERRFGHIFIVCATGKSAEEMLGLLRARLPNPPDVEIHIAAEEHARITELRLKALGSSSSP